jgi:hypothetical protein
LRSSQCPGHHGRSGRQSRLERGGFGYRTGKEQENLEALKNAPVEQPRHLLPSGGLTSAPSRATLDALPLTPEPNVGVLGGIAPGFASVKGFVGLFGGENAKVIGG